MYWKKVQKKKSKTDESERKKIIVLNYTKHFSWPHSHDIISIPVDSWP